jgi:hypothetical protein
MYYSFFLSYSTKCCVLLSPADRFVCCGGFVRTSFEGVGCFSNHVNGSIIRGIHRKRPEHRSRLEPEAPVSELFETCEHAGLASDILKSPARKPVSIANITMQTVIFVAMFGNKVDVS